MNTVGLELVSRFYRLRTEEITANVSYTAVHRHLKSAHCTSVLINLVLINLVTYSSLSSKHRIQYCCLIYAKNWKEVRLVRVPLKHLQLVRHEWLNVLLVKISFMICITIINEIVNDMHYCIVL